MARASRWPSWPSCSRSSAMRLFPGPLLPTRAGLRRAGPGVPRAGQRAGGMGALAWRTAPSRPPWRWAPTPHPWQPAEDGALRPVGHGAPGARAPDGAGSSSVPARRRHRLTGWLLLDREALGDAVSVDALPALDGTRAVGQLTIAGDRPVDGAAERPGHGLRRRRARPGPHAGGGRECRPRPLVPGDGVGLRQGACAVRPPDRAVPGGQARAGRHAGLGGAVRRGGLGRRGGLERGRRVRGGRRGRRDA